MDALFALSPKNVQEGRERSLFRYGLDWRQSLLTTPEREGASFSLYQDDGRTRSYQQGGWFHDTAEQILYVDTHEPLRITVHDARIDD